MNYEKIKELCEIQRVTIPQLAEKIGMSKGGLYSSIENGSMKVDSLEKIADVFKVPISVFFNEAYKSTESIALDKVIMDLMESIRSKDKEIESKDELIETQKELLKRYKEEVERHHLMMKRLESAIKGFNKKDASIIKFIIHPGLFDVETDLDDNQTKE